jgi:hypothetical protein
VEELGVVGICSCLTSGEMLTVPLKQCMIGPAYSQAIPSEGLHRRSFVLQVVREHLAEHLVGQDSGTPATSQSFHAGRHESDDHGL